MTTYGTIPTASSASTNLEFISRGKEQIRSGLGLRRPWKEVLHLYALTLPISGGDAFQRLRTNGAYFRMNYAIVVLVILFLSLLWHPISLIVFAVVMAAWLFFYFLRDEPLVLFARAIDDRAVLFVLSALTIVFLLLTHVTLNIVVALSVGAAVVILHAVFRRTDDLFVDDEAGFGHANAVIARMPLKDAASASFSS